MKKITKENPMTTQLTAQEQLQILKRGVAEIIPEEELLAKLEKSIKTNTPLRIKLGVDPTAPDIHLGFTVVMRKLAQFQKLGHQVVLIVGDYTATVGDPSGKATTRKRLTHEEVLKNAETYQEQFFRIVDKDKTEVTFNGDWFSKLSFNEVTQLMSKITVAQMLERQDFQNRHANNQPISLHEFMYPMMQGYDSVVIRADVEIGGTDQKFNVIRGRELQRAEEQEPQIGLFMPILLGTCGKEKMSKSLGNYIGINESPQAIYHKVYSIPDSLILNWFELLTDVSIDEMEAIKLGLEDGSMNPNQVKHQLASDIVAQYYGQEEATKAKEAEAAIHSGSAIPADAPCFEIKQDSITLLDLVSETKAMPSRGEAKKMAKNGGIKINGKAVPNPMEEITLNQGEVVLQVGKRKFFRVNVEA